MLRLGFSREQAVLAGSNRQRVSSTDQEGLDFGNVRCHRRPFVRYFSFSVVPNRNERESVFFEETVLEVLVYTSIRIL